MAADPSAAAPPCPPPRPDYEPARFPLPPGACDAHAHVVSADTDRYPLVAARSYTPPPAPESAYLRMLEATGMSRGVLVQISVYGTDNRYMLEVLGRHPRRLRGIAVVDAGVAEAELARMHALGVRGVRLNVLCSAVASASTHWRRWRPRSRRSAGISSCCSTPASCHPCCRG